MTTDFRRSAAIAAATLTAILTGCGGGGGGGGSSSVPTGPTITGVVATGLVGRGQVTAYCTTGWTPSPGAVPATSIGSAITGTTTYSVGGAVMPTGAYSLTLTTTCADPVLLVVTPQASVDMLVADEFSNPPPPSSVHVATTTNWSLRAYTNVAAGQVTTQHITPFTDMAAAIIDKAIIFYSNVTTVSSGLVTQANAAVVHTVLGDDPDGMFTAAPYDPSLLANPPASTPTKAQQQIVTLLAAVSVYAQESNLVYGAIGPTCNDPVACGGVGESALSRLEEPIAAAVAPTISATGYTRVGDTTALPMFLNNNLTTPETTPDFSAVKASASGSLTPLEVPTLLQWYVDRLVAVDPNFFTLVPDATASASGLSAVLQTSINSVTAGI